MKSKFYDSPFWVDVHLPAHSAVSSRESGKNGRKGGNGKGHRSDDTRIRAGWVIESSVSLRRGNTRRSRNGPNGERRQKRGLARGWGVQNGDRAVKKGKTWVI